MALTSWMRFVPGRDPDTTLLYNRQPTFDFLRVGRGSEEKNSKCDDPCDFLSTLRPWERGKKLWRKYLLLLAVECQTTKIGYRLVCCQQ